MKITPLFNNDDISFLLFNSFYSIQKYTIITKTDYEIK